MWDRPIICVNCVCIWNTAGVFASCGGYGYGGKDRCCWINQGRLTRFAERDVLSDGKDDEIAKR
jgi:hypothetical protein